MDYTPLDFITHFMCILGLLRSLRGDCIAVDGNWCDIKLHCRETGEVYQWNKHTDKTPRTWFKCNKVYFR